MENNKTTTMKYWIHPDGFLYFGDQVEGAREATQEEIDGPQKTNAEKYQEELSELASKYNADVIVLSDGFAKAALIDGVSEVTKKTEIYNEYVSRKSTYLSDIATLKSKYGV